MLNIFQNKSILSGLVLMAIGASIINLPRPLDYKHVMHVPFATQAPLGNWDDNKDCEETSVLMANAYFNGNRAQRLPVNEVVAQLTAMKQWEEPNLGYNRDTGIEATARLASENVGLKVDVVEDFTVEDLKRALSNNHPILLPMDASRLGNVRYPAGVPFYHMVLITGYEGDNFFVHDPGTESGRGNIYSFEILKHSGADWNHETQSMDFNIKSVLVLSK
jgi:hypothetical protein